jgi:hypothetical protein
MNMLGLSSSARITLIACYWQLFLLHYMQLYTTSHVVWDESIKADPLLYVSLAAVYWAHSAAYRTVNTYVPVIKISRLIQLREIIAVYWENRMTKDTETHYYNAEIFMLKQVIHMETNVIYRVKKCAFKSIRSISRSYIWYDTSAHPVVREDGTGGPQPD